MRSATALQEDKDMTHEYEIGPLYGTRENVDRIQGQWDGFHTVTHDGAMWLKPLGDWSADFHDIEVDTDDYGAHWKREDIESLKSDHVPHHPRYLSDTRADIVCKDGCCEWPMQKDECTGHVWDGSDFFAYHINTEGLNDAVNEMRVVQCKAIIRAAQVRTPQPTDPTRSEVWHYTKDGEPMHKADEGMDLICRELCRQLVKHKYHEATGKLVEKSYPVSFTQS